jgi:hypothetical protein
MMWAACAIGDAQQPGVKSLEDFTTAAWPGCRSMSHCEAASRASKSERAQLTQHRSSAKTSVHFTHTQSNNQTINQTRYPKNNKATDRPTNQTNQQTHQPSFTLPPTAERTNKQTNKQQTNIFCFSACRSLASSKHVQAGNESGMCFFCPRSLCSYLVCGRGAPWRRSMHLHFHMIL